MVVICSKCKEKIEGKEITFKNQVIIISDTRLDLTSWKCKKCGESHPVMLSDEDTKASTAEFNEYARNCSTGRGNRAKPTKNQRAKLVALRAAITEKHQILTDMFNKSFYHLEGSSEQVELTLPTTLGGK